MSCTRRPRRSCRTLVSGVATLVMLTAGQAVGVPTRAPAPEREPLVRLVPDRHSVVRSATVPLSAGEQRLPTTAYSLVAATWQGNAPRVRVRAGGTGPWHELSPLSDLPQPGTEGEASLRGTELLWTGPQTDIEVRVEAGRARDVQLVLIDPGEAEPQLRERTGAVRSRAADGTTPDRAPRPELRSRKAWGADNSWRNGKPRYNKRLKQVHLHHTATGNDYRRKDVPGIIRGMYRYHTKTLGWFDIGYNFLVDRFGRTWVGRSGGPARLVRGAHTLGFNHSSVGIAVIGNYQDKKPRRDVITAVQRLAAWKLDQHGRRAEGKVWVRSQGSDTYAEGERARLPAFDGHRDTNDTACPGDRLYDRLPRLRRITQRRIDRFS